MTRYYCAGPSCPGYPYRASDLYHPASCAAPDSGEWWLEYDAAAEWCAKRGLRGEPGDPLPEMLSARCKREIEQHPLAFQERVRDTSYALAMSLLNLSDGD